MENKKTILLADDNPDDVYLVKAAFTRAGYDFPILAVPNGEEAIEYFMGVGQYADRNIYPIPALLLLDLKMPGIDGFEVLRAVRSQSGWKAVPIIVLTNSCQGSDINQGYKLGANSFLTKPDDFTHYVDAIKQVVNFWLTPNSLAETAPFLIVPEVQVEPSKIPGSAGGDWEPEIDGVVQSRVLPIVPPENVPPSSPPPAA